MKLLNLCVDSALLKTGRIFDDKILLAWMSILILLRLWLVEVYELMATWTPHDDYLFIMLAKHLLSGDWLGPYNQLTLIKGPGYPLFIAASHLAGIPLLFSQQLLYSFACLLAVAALRPMTAHRGLLMACFALLLLNPFLYNYPVPGRVFREGFSISLVLIVFASLLGCINHLGCTLKRAVSWSVGFGSAFTLLWYTREEGIWLLPSVTLCSLIILLIDRDNSAISTGRRLLIILLPAGIFAACSLGFASLNYKHYGEFIINELKSREFTAAYGGLMNIKPAKFIRFVPVAESTMEEAFAASPAFRELQPSFTKHAQEAQLVPSFYIWSLRDMVREAGYSGNLTESLHFYRRIGDDLALACQDGRLDCLARAPSLQPPWHESYNSLVIPVFSEIFKQAVGFTRFHNELEKFNTWQSSGSREVIADYAFVTLERILSSDRRKVGKYPEYYQHMRIEKVRLLQDIGDSYKVLAPVLFAVAVLIHLFLLFRAFRRRQCAAEIVSGAVLLGGLISLIAVLSFVKITLWPIGRPLYSAYPVVLLYICYMLICFLKRPRPAEAAIS